MTELVTCKVCGCQAPLGTVECPDCGAPLPTEVEVLAQPAVEGEAALSPDADGPVADPPVEKKRRFIPVVAGLLVLCLLIPAVLWLARPPKEPPPGVMFVWNGLVTPDGVWDFTAEGFYYMDGTTDGRYVLLREMGEGAAGLAYSWQDYVYGPSITMGMGDYCLFDGRTLEHTDWETVHLIDNGAVFYTQKDDAGTTLFRRDLNRGKTVKIDRFVGEGYLDHFVYALDGSAAAYRWTEDGEEEPGEYYLWRQGEKAPISMGISGQLYSVGAGGRTCLFWKDPRNSASPYGAVSYSSISSSSVWNPSNYSLWRDGEVLDLPEDMPLERYNADLTQFILRETGEDNSVNWYYYAPGETDEPVLLDVPEDSYLVPVGSVWFALKSLKDCFYTLYDDNGQTLCYLADDLTLLTVEENVDSIAMSEDGKTTLSLKKGDLYQARTDKNGTLEAVALTNTVQPDITSSYYPATAYPGTAVGTVSKFTASTDLKHIYYLTRENDYPRETTLHYRYDGEDRTLDFAIDGYYNDLAITVTDSGGCYFVYQGDVYYTENGQPPALVMENAGSDSGVWLVGKNQWPLLMSYQWESSENPRKAVCWRLDDNTMPVELEEWYPEEGTL